MRRSWMAFAIAAPLLALAACDTGSPVGTGGISRLTVQLTDAPADLAEAWVQVKKVQLVPAEHLQTTTSEADATAEPVELTPAEGWIDLLTLQDGQTQALFTGDVPAGEYSQVRLVVCDMVIKTTDGQVIATPGTTPPEGMEVTTGSELKLASACQTGFKVVLRGAVKLTADNASTLTIDFDAKRSFAHQAGRSGKWIVTPVLFGSVSGGAAATGSIAGNVTLADGITLPACGGSTDPLTADAVLSKFVPVATGTDAAAHTGTTTAQGAFTIANLAADTYALSADALTFDNGDVLSYTATATPASVAVTAGSAETANYAVSAVTCTPKP